MKRKVFFVLLTLLLVVGWGLSEQKKQAAPSTPAATKLQLTQCALRVSGMTCDGCAGMVKQGLLKVEGVKAAKVDWKSGNVEAQYDPKKTTPEKMVAAFNRNNPGFRAQLPKPN